MGARSISSFDQDPRVREVGKRVRDARVAAGLSQAALAREAGLSRTSVHTLEAGIGCPNFGTLLVIGDAVGVKVSSFVDGL